MTWSELVAGLHKAVKQTTGGVHLQYEPEGLPALELDSLMHREVSVQVDPSAADTVVIADQPFVDLDLSDLPQEPRPQKDFLTIPYPVGTRYKVSRMVKDGEGAATLFLVEP